MKKILPNIFKIIRPHSGVIPLGFSILISFLFLIFFLSSTTPTFAQAVPDGAWIQDPEVTFVGKAATRSDQFLNWVLKEYQWVYIQQGGTNPLSAIWFTIFRIVAGFLALFIIISAFVMIVTRGRSLTLKRFIIRFGSILVLIVLSFAIIQGLYQLFDFIQGSFLTKPDGKIIQSSDLFHIAFNYQDFVGYRLTGGGNEESAFISLLLIKLTAITYYAMVGLLLLRKIILWFFIIVSPIFPLLLFFSPIRNTAKIWIGEFFRWLLYAPLFAIFLNGLVSLWAKSTPTSTGIPLNFDFAGVGTDVVYPTAINILLGGPGQQLALTNSINIKDTFILYVVALLMLWVVILLPFLLLQIFLDYLRNLSFGEGSTLRQVFNAGMPFLNKYGFSPTPPPGSPPPGKYQPTGMAKQLPFINKTAVQIPSIERERQTIQQSREVSTEVLRLNNISVPTMRDIARFETATITKNIARHQQLAQTHETLERIANPALIASPIERKKFYDMKNKLQQAQSKGDPLAASILTAANTTTKIKSQSTQSTQKTSSSLQSTQKTSSQLGMQKVAGVNAAPVSLPTTNRIQSVNLDEYESVKKMWVENYENLEVPQQLGQESRNREEWIQQDIDKITQVINLLSSAEQTKINQAMDMVGSILPFLLIGGFSQQEIIAYLKAKMEAAKTVKASLKNKEEESDTLLEVTKKEETKTMEQEAKLPDPLDNNDQKSDPSK